MSGSISIQTEHNLIYKLRHINWGLVCLIVLIACIGFFCALFSRRGKFGAVGFETDYAFFGGCGCP